MRSLRTGATGAVLADDDACSSCISSLVFDPSGRQRIVWGRRSLPEADTLELHGIDEVVNTIRSQSLEDN